MEQLNNTGLDIDIINPDIKARAALIDKTINPGETQKQIFWQLL